MEQFKFIHQKVRICLHNYLVILGSETALFLPFFLPSPVILEEFSFEFLLSIGLTGLFNNNFRFGLLWLKIGAISFHKFFDVIFTSLIEQVYSLHLLHFSTKLNNCNFL